MNKLQTVSERIVGEEAPAIPNTLVRAYAVAMREQNSVQRIEIGDNETWVCLGGWTERIFNAKVKLGRACLQPETTAGTKRFRFLQFRKAEQCAIKGTRLALGTLRYRDLHMIKAHDGHLWRLQSPRRYFSTVCSMAPKIERPALSFISIRTVSPKRMKGVEGEPFSMVSMVRISAMQE